MSWYVWLLVGGYALSVVWAFRIIMGELLANDIRSDGKIPGEELAVDVVFTLSCCWFGPCVVVWRAIMDRTNGDGLMLPYGVVRLLASPTPEMKRERVQSLERQARADQDRIRELERELGVNA